MKKILGYFFAGTQQFISAFAGLGYAETTVSARSAIHI